MVGSRVAVPADAVTLAGLPRVDYADAFSSSAEVTGDATPEQRLRVALASAPPGLMTAVPWAQRGLGLHLTRPDEAHPLGWTILRSDDEVVVLGADGAVVQARLVARTSASGRAVLITQLQFHARRPRAVWVAISPVHRAVAALLIDRAASA